MSTLGHFSHVSVMQSLIGCKLGIVLLNGDILHVHIVAGL